MKQRQALVPRARGVVLEVGAGSCLNLPFYDREGVRSLMLLEPDKKLAELGQDQRHVSPIDFEFVSGWSQDLPLDSNSCDTIVLTYTLCSIEKLEESFKEFRRVLKPGAQLLFCEHSLSPERSIQKWQNGLNPFWQLFSGGCQLNRDIPKLLTEHGFQIQDEHRHYIRGWKPACWNVRGCATPR